MRMRKKLIALFVSMFGLPTAAIQGQPVSYSGLPNGAVILDQEAVPAWAHRDRRLLFWVLPPPGSPLSAKDTAGEIEYTCPLETSGHSRLLPARVSLADTRARRIVNTIPVKIS